MNKPKVSVVMSVYNGAKGLPETIESVLDQDGVDLEFIIVNDGSTDDTGLIVQEHAHRDARIRIVEQENSGLTRALIRGCAEAKGEFIARQDAGDVSLPGRLVKQADLLRSNKEIVMASCGTRFMGPSGEVVREVIQSPRNAVEGLHRLSLDGIQGPSHHGGVMFRRDVYEQIGGYRWQFSVAQDIDLWLRLAEKGRHDVLCGIYYQATMSPGAISFLHRDQQVRMAELILEAARSRRRGDDDAVVLERASRLAAIAENDATPRDTAAYYYFLGCNLASTNRKLARHYYVKAIRSNPFHLKAVARWMQCGLDL